jgi:hypothetical protein
MSVQLHNVSPECVVGKSQIYLRGKFFPPGFAPGSLRQRWAGCPFADYGADGLRIATSIMPRVTTGARHHDNADQPHRGDDQIVDEMLIAFTHDRVIDCTLPGVAPTGRRIEVPTVAIVRFENGNVACEHIYRDQASALVQAGLIDPEGLPIAGAEVAAKLKDPTLPSSTLIRTCA